jgi:hypothetical protein
MKLLTHETWRKNDDETMELVNVENELVDDTEQVQAQRADAYRYEADPLFFKVQRGEVEQQVWLDKVEEIRQRYPYSTDELKSKK